MGGDGGWEMPSTRKTALTLRSKTNYTKLALRTFFTKRWKYCFFGAQFWLLGNTPHSRLLHIHLKMLNIVLALWGPLEVISIPYPHFNLISLINSSLTVKM